MSPVVQSALVTTLGLIVIALITYRQTRKGSKATDALAERTVAKDEFDSIVRELRADLDRVRSDLREVEAELETEVEARRKAEKRAEEAESRAAAAERRATEAEQQVAQLTLRVTQLESELATAKAALRVAVHDDDTDKP